MKNSVRPDASSCIQGWNPHPHWMSSLSWKQVPLHPKSSHVMSSPNGLMMDNWTSHLLSSYSIGQLLSRSFVGHQWVLWCHMIIVDQSQFEQNQSRSLKYNEEVTQRNMLLFSILLLANTIYANCKSCLLNLCTKTTITKPHVM